MTTSRYRHQTTPSAPGSYRAWHSALGGTTELKAIPRPAKRSWAMNDWITPKFHERQANGEIFNNPLSSSTSTFDANDSRHEMWSDSSVKMSAGSEWTNGTALSQFLDVGVWPTVDFDMSAIRSEAQTQALGNVNKTDLDLGTLLGEWSKTKRLHRDLGNALVRLFTEEAKVLGKVDAVKRISLWDETGRPITSRKWKGKKVKNQYLHRYRESKLVRGRSQKSVQLANIYLIKRFGIEPLLHDLENSIKLLVDAHAKRRTARGVHVAQGQASAVKRILAFNNNEFSVELVTTRTLTMRYGILYESDIYSRLAGRLGLTRPLSTMWELTPYSFVLDRFVEIGHWLDAIQPTGITKTLAAWGSSTDFVVHTATVMDSFKETVGSFTREASWKGSLITTNELKTRWEWEMSLPKFPSISEGDIKPLHALDYVALVLQKLSMFKK